MDDVLSTWDLLLDLVNHVLRLQLLVGTHRIRILGVGMLRVLKALSSGSSTQVSHRWRDGEVCMQASVVGRRILPKS